MGIGDLWSHFCAKMGERVWGAVSSVVNMLMERGPESSGEGVLRIVGSMGLEQAGVTKSGLVSTHMAQGLEMWSTMGPLLWC